MPNHDPLKSVENQTAAGRGGFVALAVLAAAVGAGAALLLAPDRGFRTRLRKGPSRREKRIIALAGCLIGAGLTALLTPESGPATRKLLGGTLSRIKVGAVDRIERLRHADAPEPAETRAERPEA
jgi:gas vesicle protein